MLTVLSHLRGAAGNPAMCHEVLDILKARRESVVQEHGVPAYLAGKTEAAVDCRRPAVIAQDKDGIAVITRGGGASASGIFFSPPGLATIHVPAYFDEIAFELKDLRPRGDTVAGGFWGTPTETTPASLYRFHRDRWQGWEGHDFDLVACASDVLVRQSRQEPESSLLVPVCDGDVEEVIPSLERLQSRTSWGRLRGIGGGADSWSEFVLTSSGDLLVGAVVRGAVGGPTARWTVLTTLGREDTNPVLESYEASLVGLAAGPEGKIVILESASGDRETLATAY